jgi:hypothetical protein
MSTNYYWNPAGKFQQFAQLHIGKHSGGWVFSFQAHDFEGSASGERSVPVSGTVCALVHMPELPALFIRSFVDWKELLSIPDSSIEDEYGAQIKAQDFITMVETSLHPVKGFWGSDANRQPLLNHFDEIVKNQHRYGKVDPELDWKDAEGYSFSLREFS